MNDCDESHFDVIMLSSSNLTGSDLCHTLQFSFSSRHETDLDISGMCQPHTRPAEEIMNILLNGYTKQESYSNYLNDSI